MLANACPEIATSVMIDAVKARFFIIVPFLAVSESPMAERCASRHSNASLVHAPVYKRDIKKNLTVALVASGT